MRGASRLAPTAGLPIVEHGGSLGGYRAHILRFPAQHTSVALLCNLGTIAPSGQARRVADIVLGDRFTQPVPPVNPWRVGSALGTLPDAPAADTLRRYAGTYYSDEVDATFTRTAKGRDLMLKRETDAEPVVMQLGAGPDEFRARGLTVRFQRDASKKVTR